MANKQMHHLTIGGDTFEIVDQVARAGVTIDTLSHSLDRLSQRGRGVANVCT